MICSKCRTERKGDGILFTACVKHREGWSIMLNEETNEVEVLPEEGWQ